MQGSECGFGWNLHLSLTTCRIEHSTPETNSTWQGRAARLKSVRDPGPTPQPWCLQHCPFVYAYGPKTGPAFLRFLLLNYFGVGGVGGSLTSLVFFLHDLRSDRLFYFVAHTSCYVGYFGVAGAGWGVRWDYKRPWSSSFTTFSALDMFSLRRCTRFMFRWIRLVYFDAHTTCYVGYVFSTSLHTLHVALDTPCLTSMRTLHVTLDTSSLLRCTHFMLRWLFRGWGGVGLLTSLVFVLHDLLCVG